MGGYDAKNGVYGGCINHCSVQKTEVKLVRRKRVMQETWLTSILLFFFYSYDYGITIHNSQTVDLAKSRTICMHEFPHHHLVNIDFEQPLCNCNAIVLRQQSIAFLFVTSDKLKAQFVQAG